jgi:hypothetical protein
LTNLRRSDGTVVAAENVAGVKDIEDHFVWVEPVLGMAFDASYKEPTGTTSPTGAASSDGQYALH